MRSVSLIPLLLGSLLAVGPRTAVAQQGALPWHVPDAPPSVAGLRLGASRAVIDSVLGPPDSVEQMGRGGKGLVYRARGLMLAYTDSEGVRLFYLDTRKAGDIGGVRVGDTREAVVARWGSPTQADGEMARYIVGGWAIVVAYDRDLQRVMGLGIRKVPPGQ